LDGALHYFYVVYGLKGDKAHDVLVNVDGHVSKRYDSVVNASFDDVKTLVFVARDGSKFLRVTVALN
jgi:hypothetical protein